MKAKGIRVSEYFEVICKHCGEYFDLGKESRKIRKGDVKCPYCKGAVATK
jgi:uncharacterized Zn-finger protein